MAKYLIQDIIPPEKHTHRGDGDNTIHHKAPEKPRAHTTHKAVMHTATHPGKKEVHESVHEEEMPTENHEPVVVEDPKEMLIEQLNSPEIEERAVEDEVPHSQNYFSSVKDTVTPAATWPYGQSRESTGAYVPPRSSVNFGGGRGGSGERSSWKRGWIPWILGIALVSVVFVLGMNYFSGATVTVLPKQDSIPMDQKITILKNPLNSELPYSVMKVFLEETREVPATGEKTVPAKASGKIIVYNTQTVSQRLIKNTRLQSPAGKIYRISDSINVPKAVTLNGKTTPGSLEVTVYADEAGPDFNTEPVDFTVPGLKGSPTFTKVYARSKGPITGGASGTIKSVSDLDLKQASDDLRIQLETKLRTKARGDLAPNQIGYDRGMLVQLEDAALSKAQSSSPDKAVVSQTGNAYFLVFDRTELTRAIVRSLIPTYNNEEVTIGNLESLELELAEMSGADLWKSEKLDIVLRGTPSLDWKVDEVAIKTLILGKPKENFNALLSQFPTIDRASATIHPVWKRSFPTDEKDITIKVVTEMPK